jgi:F420-0:gamma-glutamyl ligase
MTKKSISISAIETRVFQAEENLFDFLAHHLTKDLLENSTLAITSKIVSLAENRIVAKDQISKKDLVKKEADHYLTEGQHGVELTITQGLLIPSAGIDESNSHSGGYILFPKDPYDSAKNIYSFLQSAFSLQNFAVILTDSRSAPLRRGVNGIALAHWGFQATKSLVGEKDIFGKALKFTHVNVADALASMAVFAMGEGAEVTPLAVISGASLEYTKFSKSSELQIPPEEDLYYPLFKPWL